MSQVFQSDLRGNDFAIILNKRVLANLAVTEDMTFRPAIEAAEKSLDALANTLAVVGTQVRRGLEDPVELVANLAMPVPRLLFATSNPNWPATFNGNTPIDKLFGRLKSYDSVATGSVIAELPSDVAGFNNPIPIKIKSDPNKRFSFIRGYYDGNSRPEVHVAGNGVTVTIRGSAFRGDVFSSYQASHQPTHSFELTLRFVARFIAEPPYVAPVTQVMLVDGPAGAPRLPKKGQVVYAIKRADLANSFVLPTPLMVNNTATEELPPGAEVFQGQAGDLIYEPGNLNAPVYRVEDRIDANGIATPVLRKIGSQTDLAEGRGGRVALVFASVDSLALNPLNGNAPVSGAEIDIIKQSLVKIHPTLAQVFYNLAVAKAALSFAQLQIVGERGFDVPILPNDFLLSGSAQILANGNGAVQSEVVEFALTESAYFADEAFGVYGKVNGQQPTAQLGNFSGGADVSIALGQGAAKNILHAFAAKQLKEIKSKVQQQGVTSQFDLDVDGAFVSDGDGDGILLRAGVHGTFHILFFTPGVDVKGQVRLNLRVQPTILMTGAGDALDSAGKPILPLLLNAFGLSLREGVLETGDPKLNPLCFVPYFDPLDGLPCFRCPPPVLVPPLAIGPPPNPPDPRCYGQASFPPFFSKNKGLKHHQSITVKPPKEGDVKVDVSTEWWAVLLAAVFALVLSSLLIVIPVFGPLITPVVQFVLISVIILSPFINLMGSSILTGLAFDALSKANRPVQDASIGMGGLVGMYLEDPAVRQPVQVQQNIASNQGDDSALITRFHVAMGVSDTNFGFNL